ncbi:DUF3558 domain-containing protein [Streptomyces sp. TRM66268-LWL]|uniref:DUF3558 domain-containing protein n=1 Tax=Streptomyces polyasparticus TaxID=2767826 RepID=A0ABR7ST97_9ACTN|nr:DUF3558 domain-containing protein [Streptomyces polyasparticus]MBC9718684.1 DUF3558 domain-containing protein [Streptomyces polyasparticus]
MHRKGPRFTRILAACAVVPVVMTAAACSSDSGDGGDKSDSGAKSSASQSADGKDKAASLAEAAYKQLPAACKVVSSKTIEDLVPKVDDKSGKTGKSSDVSTRSSCSWKGLDNNGVDGSQFRWLSASLMRFESEEGLGSAETRAKDYFKKQAAAAAAAEGAKNVKSEPADGIGDSAVTVSYDLDKGKLGDYKQQTVVTRIENVVLTLDYNGAGLAGEKAPKAEEMVKDAEKAAKEAVASVTAANKPGASTEPSDKASGEPSQKTSAKPSAKASAKS